MNDENETINWIGDATMDDYVFDPNIEDGYETKNRALPLEKVKSYLKETFYYLENHGGEQLDFDVEGLVWEFFLASQSQITIFLSLVSKKLPSDGRIVFTIEIVKERKYFYTLHTFANVEIDDKSYELCFDEGEYFIIEPGYKTKNVR